MINLNKHDGPRPKCYFTSSVLPEYIDHDQLPMKKKPFSTMSQHDCSYSVGVPLRVLSLALLRCFFQLTVVMPSSQADDMNSKLDSGIGTLQYAQVYMKLNEVIEGDFFNHYIKSGMLYINSSLRTFSTNCIPRKCLDAISG